MSRVKRPISAEDPVRAMPKGAAKWAAWVEDSFLESWVSWRESCEDVRGAYQSWATSERSERGLAFVGYRAALDREQHAASVHSEWAERLRALAG